MFVFDINFRGSCNSYGTEDKTNKHKKKSSKKKRIMKIPRERWSSICRAGETEGKSFLPISAERPRTRMKAGYAHALARERVQMSRDRRSYTGAPRIVEWLPSESATNFRAQVGCWHGPSLPAGVQTLESKATSSIILIPDFFFSLRKLLQSGVFFFFFFFLLQFWRWRALIHRIESASIFVANDLEWHTGGWNQM